MKTPYLLLFYKENTTHFEVKWKISSTFLSSLSSSNPSLFAFPFPLSEDTLPMFTIIFWSSFYISTRLRYNLFFFFFFKNCCGCDAYSKFGNTQAAGTLVPHDEVGCFIVALYFSLSLNPYFSDCKLVEEATLLARYPLQQVLDHAMKYSILLLMLKVWTDWSKQDTKICFLRCIWVPCTFCKAEDEKVIWLYSR